MSIPSTVRGLLQPNRQTSDLVLTTYPPPVPAPNTTEHLIKVHATAPCAGELLWLKNYASLFASDRLDVPCYDLSGVVITAPANSPFRPGTEIYTRTPASRTGNAREYTIATTEELAIKPKNLSWEEAASVPLSAFSAYQALFEHGGLKAAWDDEAGRKENGAKRVIVTAAAGGVGNLVMQLARAAGVTDLVAVVGPKNIDFVKELGASEVVNYRQQSLGEWAAGNRKADLIIDMVGGQTLRDAWGAVKDGGILLSINTPPDAVKPENVAAKDVKASFFIMESYGWQLKEVADLLQAGKVKPVVDSVFGLDDYQKAFDKVESGHARGKVILKL